MITCECVVLANTLTACTQILSMQGRQKFPFRSTTLRPKIGNTEASLLPTMGEAWVTDATLLM